MGINFSILKPFVNQCSAKSVLQTKPLAFTSSSVKFQPLQKDTFTPSLKKMGESLKAQASKFKTLSTIEMKAFEKRVQEAVKNNFSGFEIVQNLSVADRKNLTKTLVKDYVFQDFALVATGEKPAIWLIGNIPKAFGHKDFDVVSFKTHVDNTLILNGEKVKGTIRENLEFYQKRLKLDPNTSVEDVYNVLKDEKTFPACRNEATDVIGLTLGYPRDCSMLFELNCRDNWKIHDNKELAKQNMKKILMSDDSPYKDFDSTFKKNLLAQIDKMNPRFSNALLAPGGQAYVFNAFVDEPSAFDKIVESIRNSSEKLKQINESVKKNKQKGKVA